MSQEELLTVGDVAGRLKVTPETIRRWIRQGRLQGTRLGGTKAGWRVPTSEVERLLAEGKEAA